MAQSIACIIMCCGMLVNSKYTMAWLIAAHPGTEAGFIAARKAVQAVANTLTGQIYIRYGPDGTVASDAGSLSHFALCLTCH